MENFNEQAQQCANEIMKWLEKKELALDVSIYVNDCRYQYNEEKGVWNKEEDMDPRDYFDFAGNFLSMSFENSLYDYLNYNYSCSVCDKISGELQHICSKYGRYFELGNAWNLSLYKV